MLLRLRPSLTFSISCISQCVWTYWLLYSRDLVTFHFYYKFDAYIWANHFCFLASYSLPSIIIWLQMQVEVSSEVWVIKVSSILSNWTTFQQVVLLTNVLHHLSADFLDSTLSLSFLLSLQRFPSCSLKKILDQKRKPQWGPQEK